MYIHGKEKNMRIAPKMGISSSYFFIRNFKPEVSQLLIF